MIKFLTINQIFSPSKCASFHGTCMRMCVPRHNKKFDCCYFCRLFSSSLAHILSPSLSIFFSIPCLFFFFAKSIIKVSRVIRWWQWRWRLAVVWLQRENFWLFACVNYCWILSQFQKYCCKFQRRLLQRESRISIEYSDDDGVIIVVGFSTFLLVCFFPSGFIYLLCLRIAIFVLHLLVQNLEFSVKRD